MLSAARRACQAVRYGTKKVCCSPLLGSKDAAAQLRLPSPSLWTSAPGKQETYRRGHLTKKGVPCENRCSIIADSIRGSYTPTQQASRDIHSIPVLGDASSDHMSCCSQWSWRIMMVVAVVVRAGDSNGIGEWC